MSTKKRRIAKPRFRTAMPKAWNPVDDAPAVRCFPVQEYADNETGRCSGASRDDKFGQSQNRLAYW